MKSFGFRLSVCWLVLAASLGLVACGLYGGPSYSSINGYMAGPWDFTVTNAKGNVPFVIEANLNQDHHGNISATGSVTANGPAGDVSDVFILSGSSLSNVSGIAVDYLGFTCNGTDSGDRSITGTVDPSNHVTLNQNVGGTAVATISGTIENSANPPFTGTLTTSGACGGNGTATVIGQYPYFPPTANYSGTNAGDNTENIVTSITNTNGSLTGDGSDSKLGNFTLTGKAVGNAFSLTLTYSSSPGNDGPVFGYYDMKLGARGSILLVSSQGANFTSCPNGEPRFNSSCLIAILAMQ